MLRWIAAGNNMRYERLLALQHPPLCHRVHSHLKWASRSQLYHVLLLSPRSVSTEKDPRLPGQTSTLNGCRRSFRFAPSPPRRRGHMDASLCRRSRERSNHAVAFCPSEGVRPEYCLAHLGAVCALP